MKQEHPSTPFDDFGGAERDVRAGRMMKRLRTLSRVALVAAFASAAVILGLDAARGLQPEFSWRMKSAIPLICIGVSYAFLQITRRQLWVEFWLSMGVSMAFILWGAEQFVGNARVAMVMDDLVVFLFVLDLAVVIWGRLREGE